MSERRGWRAPGENGMVLADPPLSRFQSILADNRRLLQSTDVDILGIPLSKLRDDARRAALAAARDYFNRSGEALPNGDGDAFLLAGHQPELFHPGVWIKNFAVNALALQHGAVPVNLVIDNDVPKSASILIPAWTDEADARRAATIADPVHSLYRPVSAAFDQHSGDAPYENRRVQDETAFRRFGEQVASQMRGWGYEPVLLDYWRRVLAEVGRTPLLGERFARARRSLEREWGCHNWELPISALAESEPFKIFVRHVLQNLARFHRIHNDSLHEFRRRNRLKSKSHPVPDLAADADWLETPFWAWQRGAGRRGRLWARADGQRIVLRVNRHEPSDIDDLKIRPRAITNTIFARLCVGDVFMHGIGGAKYDELTDAIIRRFFGIEPPQYLTVTGTLRLPLPTFARSDATFLAQSRLLRDAHWNPQRHFRIASEDAAKLAEEKQVWIQKQPMSRNDRRERWLRIRKLSEDLRPLVAAQSAHLAAATLRARFEADVNQTLLRRDFAFCLYPETALRGFLGGVADLV